ncbi:hypothetical protein BE20_05395 [Sorangium cellulosum]|nr:hypothetical protein BE20_05395 [Sorangium cellulosum]
MTPVLKAARERPLAHALPGVELTPPPGARPEAALLPEALGGDAQLAAEAAAIAEAGAGLATHEERVAPGSQDDDPLARFDATDEPPVRLADTGGEPLPMARFRAAIVDACAETIAMLARHRWQRPAVHRPSIEARILVQTEAILATGAGCVAEVVRWWMRALEGSDPWKSWAPAFVLGSIEGPAPLEALAHGIERLPGDALWDALAIAEALAVAPHPDLAQLGSSLLASRHPVARAVGVDVCSRRGGLSHDDLARWLQRGEAPVALAAIRAIDRCEAREAREVVPPSVVPLLRARLRDPSPAVAWGAARALTIAGHRDPYEEVCARDDLVAVLGARALELFVLAGRAEDLRRMEGILSRAPITPEALSAIGRFGHPGSWAFLTHFLADEDLADAAASALATLFGPAVPAPDRKRAIAWKSAIGAARLDPALRYRLGEPWRLETVAVELSSGLLDRDEAQRRADEIAARAGLGRSIELALWTPDPEDRIAALTAACAQGSRGSPAGGWT